MIDKRIIKILKKMTGKTEKVLRKENYLDQEILDSFAFLVLISELEKEFKISIKNNDLLIKNFENLINISKVVSKYLKK